MLEALTQDRWQRIAPTYGAVERFIERRVFAPWRARVWSLVRGNDVLEVAVGTGSNMPYYPTGVRITAFDISAARVDRARQRAAILGLEVDLRVMDAEHLEFPARAFDTVLATWVFCSVPNPVPALRELGRVCRPDGQILLLEHVRIDAPVMGRLMDWFDPLAVRMGAGHINRHTVEIVRQSGLEIERVEDVNHSGLVKLIVARVRSSTHRAQEGQ
jgi:phosphatidylethanolamine/phosphatidyl-N-methylethanolamine N-methyltransferase